MASVVEFVALGPGGAHLVTARALAALHAVQYVYYPELGGPRVISTTRDL